MAVSASRSNASANSISRPLQNHQIDVFVTELRIGNLLGARPIPTRETAPVRVLVFVHRHHIAMPARDERLHP